MGQKINIYCDESCHLPNDGNKLMVLGAISCSSDEAREVSLRIRDIKLKHGIAASSELKWSKISPGNSEFYCDLIDYYFDNDHLNFRGVVAKGKDRLDHDKYDQDHDIWYFKMYFLLIQHILEPDNHYKVFLDVKDTKSQVKTKNLHDVLCNKNYDFDRKIIEDVRTISSHTTTCMQLADLFAGALSYLHRGLNQNSGKNKVIDKIKKRSGKTLLSKTLMRERKLNIFIWEPGKDGGNNDTNL